MEPIDFANNCLEEVENWETLMFLYDAALRQVSTKIDILVSLSKLHILNCQNFNSTPQRTFLSIPLL